MSILTNNGKIFTYENSIVTTVVKTLNDYTWAEIRAISDAGTGANYWSVGDTKTIVINGTVGKNSFDNLSIDCFILGFNHNAEKEGNNRIHFGIGKNGDKLVGLVDAVSSTSTATSPGHFSMNWDSYDYNIGGWKGCQLRNTVLQGTGTPDAPIANTMLAAFPADLLTVLKSVTKYTDNVGYTDPVDNETGSVASNITATTDYLFIPALFEVFTSAPAEVTNIYEAAQQVQYDYFKNGNSRILYKYNHVSEKSAWWLRSPSPSSRSYFCDVGVRGELGR